MSAQSRKLRRWEGGGRAGYHFQCPGCEDIHTVNDGWGFNGNLDLPTFTPSILVTGFESPTEEEVEAILRGDEVERRPLRCHSYLTDGVFNFLTDCTHGLAGKTAPLPDLPDYMLDEGSK